MKSYEFTYLLDKPELVSADHNLELEKILKEFPYFQSARILQLKLLHKQDSFKYNSALKVAAAYTTNRKILFDFITTDAFLNKNKSFLKDKNNQAIEIDLPDTLSIEESTPEFVKKQEPVESIPPKKETPIVLVQNEQEINDFNSSPLLDKNIDYNNINVILPNSLENSIRASIDISSKEIEKQKEIEYTKSKVSSWLEDVVESDTKSVKEIVDQLEETLNKQEETSKNTVSFTKNETHSFQEWLQLANMKPIEREAEIIEETTQNKTSEALNLEDKLEIIDKFIESNPKISPPKEPVPLPSYFSKSEDTPYLMTETLAKIYLEQKKYSRAIQAYEILILKYPEKSSLFADRILDIKDLQQNNNK